MNIVEADYFGGMSYFTFLLLIQFQPISVYTHRICYFLAVLNEEKFLKKILVDMSLNMKEMKQKSLHNHVNFRIK